jgi:peptidoglycan/LPS O-acetylase OafA/YrhL
MTMMNATINETQAAPTIPTTLTPSTEKYNYAIGYLRAFVVALVIAHHTALAYHPFAPPVPTSLAAQPRWWEAFPIVDTHRWSGFSLFVGFNDVFFMSLMFFLSGLFVWNGLQRKGSAKYLRNRLLRLGLPFVVAAALLAPLAYYPTYLQISGHAGFAGFWHQWIALGQWPAGPVWFVWVLLVFDGFAALLFALAPSWVDALDVLNSVAARRPAVFFAVLVAISALVYIPMALHFPSLAWTAFGPFTFQTSRIFHYMAYFLIAVSVGAWGLDRGLVAQEGKLARRWLLWVVAALVLFGAATAITLIALTSAVPSQALTFAMDAGFVLSCAAISFAFLAVFLRFVRSRSRFFDGLSANSYGIYLLHYAFVSWLQYALLPTSLPAVAKALIVFVGALGLSWGTAATLRRIPAVARVV